MRAGLADVVQRADVWVIQRRGRTPFALEALERSLIVRELVGKELQGDGAAQAGIRRLIDDTHTADANPLEDPVVRNGLTFEPSGCWQGYGFGRDRIGVGVPCDGPDEPVA